MRIERIEPAKTAMIVVDMQNDFVAPGGGLSPSGNTTHGCLLASRYTPLVAATMYRPMALPAPSGTPRRPLVARALAG